jgi:hypothetical protein
MSRWATAFGLSPPRSRPEGPVPPAPTTRTPARFEGALDEWMDYDGIFRVVRDSTRAVLGRERPGLGLALSDLPPSLGAYWPVTGNLIVLNEGLVETMRRHAGSPRVFNSFVYVILAHEYLHTLGYLAESQVRPATAYVARHAFGPDHPATRMAEGDLWRMFPFLAEAPPGRGDRLRVVPGFDRDSTFSYIR